MAANNPAACAVAEARRLWPDEDLFVLSLGTGTADRPIDVEAASGWGLLGWMPNITGVVMDGASDVVPYQLDRIPGVTHVRIAPPGTTGIALDDARPASISRLTALGAETVRVHAAELPEVILALPPIPSGDNST